MSIVSCDGENKMEDSNAETFAPSSVVTLEYGVTCT